MKNHKYYLSMSIIGILFVLCTGCTDIIHKNYTDLSIMVFGGMIGWGIGMLF